MRKHAFEGLLLISDCDQGQTSKLRFSEYNFQWTQVMYSVMRHHPDVWVF